MTRPEHVDSVADSIGAASQYDGDPVLHDGGHLFEGERCIYCHTNVYDIGIYPDAPAICPVPRQPLRFSTETPTACATCGEIDHSTAEHASPLDAIPDEPEYSPERPGADRGDLMAATDLREGEK
jgi:hypothetical protein